MFQIIVNGVPVQCETVEELKSLVTAFAGQIGAVEGSPGKLHQGKATGAPTKKRPPQRSPGSGPKKSWAMADWFAKREKISRNEARSLLAEFKQGDPPKFFKLVKDFEAAHPEIANEGKTEKELRLPKPYWLMAEWYAEKNKLSREESRKKLATMLRDERPAFDKLYKEWEKKK